MASFIPYHLVISYDTDEYRWGGFYLLDLLDLSNTTIYHIYIIHFVFKVAFRYYDVSSKPATAWSRRRDARGTTRSYDLIYLIQLHWLNE